MEEKRKYNVKQLLKFVNIIENILGGEGVIDYIAVTPNEFSIYINNGISMLLVKEIDEFKEIFSPDTVFFNENNPQLIIANTQLQEGQYNNQDIQYFIDFVNITSIHHEVKTNDINLLLGGDYSGTSDTQRYYKGVFTKFILKIG